MRKILLFAFCLFVMNAPHVQSQVTNALIEEVFLFSDGFHNDLGLSFLTMSANNSFSKTSSLQSRWFGVGFSGNSYLHEDDRLNLYVSVSVDVGWSSKSDNVLLDMYGAFNAGYVFSFDSLPYFTLTPHLGVGVMDNMIFIDESSSVYRSERIYRTCGYVPIGLKLAYKRLFFDVAYRLTFLRSKLHNAEEFDYYDDYYKSASEYTGTVKTFPLCFTVGYSF